MCLHRAKTAEKSGHVRAEARKTGMHTVKEKKAIRRQELPDLRFI